MTKIITFISTILILGSCTVYKYLPAENQTKVRDSVVVNYIDSVIYHHRTVNRDYRGLLDTLRIKGTHSSMTAFADTSNFTINGELNEEPYKERVVYRDRIQYRDSIQYVEKPYPVEVIKEKKIHYKYEKWLWFISMIALAYFGYKFYRFILRFSGADIGSLFKKN